MAREGNGSNKDGKHYWLTPPDLLESLNAEFRFDFDACPYPRPTDFDGLQANWGTSTYVNPPFAGPTAWVRKAIGESEQGKRVTFVFPVPKWVLMLLTHPNLKDVRNLKDVKWCAIEDGAPGKGIGQHIACFVLDGTKGCEICGSTEHSGLYKCPVAKKRLNYLNCNAEIEE